MNAIATALSENVGKLVHLLARGLNLFQPLLALGVRVWVGIQFWKSGFLKLQSWDSTVYLFREEYHVPILPPELAALVGTFGELFFPVLLFIGLFGRLGALGMSAVNIMAVVSYAHVLLAPGFEGALAQHVLWGFMLLVLIVYGPGRFSLDHLLFNRRDPAGPV